MEHAACCCGGLAWCFGDPTRPSPRAKKWLHACRRQGKAWLVGCWASQAWVWQGQLRCIRRPKHGRGGRGVYVPVVGLGQGHGLPTPRQAMTVVTRGCGSPGMCWSGSFPRKKCPKAPLGRQRSTGRRNVHCSGTHPSRALCAPTAHHQAPLFQDRRRQDGQMQPLFLVGAFSSPCIKMCPLASAGLCSLSSSRGRASTPLLLPPPRPPGPHASVPSQRVNLHVE